MSRAIDIDDLGLIVELCETLQIKQIAEKFDCNPQNVKDFLKTHGYTSAEIKREYYERFLLKNYSSMTQNQLCKALKTRTETIEIVANELRAKGHALVKDDPFSEGDAELLAELAKTHSLKELYGKWEVSVFVMRGYLEKHDIDHTAIKKAYQNEVISNASGKLRVADMAEILGITDAQVYYLKRGIKNANK